MTKAQAIPYVHEVMEFPLSNQALEEENLNNDLLVDTRWHAALCASSDRSAQTLINRHILAYKFFCLLLFITSNLLALTRIVFVSFLT